MKPGKVDLHDLYVGTSTVLTNLNLERNAATAWRQEPACCWFSNSAKLM